MGEEKLRFTSSPGPEVRAAAITHSSGAHSEIHLPSPPATVASERPWCVRYSPRAWAIWGVFCAWLPNRVLTLASPVLLHSKCFSYKLPLSPLTPPTHAHICPQAYTQAHPTN